MHFRLPVFSVMSAAETRSRLMIRILNGRMMESSFPLHRLLVCLSEQVMSVRFLDTAMIFTAEMEKESFSVMVALM